MCEKTFESLAHVLSELGKQGKKAEAIQQVEQCAYERKRSRMDPDHERAVKHLGNLAGELRTLPFKRFFVTYSRREDGFSVMPFARGGRRKTRKARKTRKH